MRRYVRPTAALLLLAIAALVISACGGSGNSGGSGTSNAGGSSSSSGGGKSAGGTVQMVMGTFPDSLDPQRGYSTQAAEVDWISYTGLVTYKHTSGVAGATLIPGLATALPVVSDGGKTYTVTLRKGLKYSNGKPVQARDFLYSFERAVKMPWGGSGSFMDPTVVGAMAYFKGKAKTISGIQANDATGKIVIHLTAPYGAFDNVLAEPSLGLIPWGFPFANQPLHPPPGCGPYMIKNVVADKSFQAVKNPYWKPLPGIPAGQDNVTVTVNSNISSNAEQVLDNSADVFDWADTIPGSLLPQIHAKASSRYKLVNLGGSTYYFFMNSQEKPFSSQLAREAVVTGLNEEAYNRLGSGTLAPACFFLPPAVAGHPKTATCPYGTPGTGNLAKAKQLMKQSGMVGQHVTVWSEERAPRVQWVTAYTQYLNSLGLKATQKPIADTTYFATIGELKLHAQTGFADWNMDFPDPVDFYGVLLDGHAILPTNNYNQGEVNDPTINRAVGTLGQIPVAKLQQDSSQWQKIDEYTAKKAYVAVFGYQKFPFFASDRMNYPALEVNPLYGWDFTSFQLK
ncbi:MAG TPA: ABC transporter substrate-binding protein [Solirubrobacteraceae bacterium]